MNGIRSLWESFGTVFEKVMKNCQINARKGRKKHKANKERVNMHEVTEMPRHATD